MSLHRYMNTFWEHRYAALIWWIAARYVFIGLEYLFSIADSSMYWAFGGFSPVVVGAWMFVIGLIGMGSRLLCWNIWNLRASWCTGVFALGVVVHSIFRMSIFVVSQRFGDPLFILFLCDAIAMFWVLVQLQRSRIHSCSR